MAVLSWPDVNMVEHSREGVSQFLGGSPLGIGRAIPAPIEMPFVGFASSATETLRGLRSLVPQLSKAETDRASTFKSSSQQTAFLASHLLARVVVGGLLNLSPADIRIEQFCARCAVVGHGRPRVLSRARDDVPQSFVSWSHAGSWVAAVASTVPVGVDIEQADTLVPQISDIFGVDELQELQASDNSRSDALRWWTRKESIVKLGLVGLDDFGDIDVRHENPSTGVIDGVRMRTVVNADYVASTACLTNAARFADVSLAPL